jgi:hypothetical protein
MMRDCSVGKSSFQSGSNASSELRTSDSVKPLRNLRARRQVWTMISGERRRRRTWSITIFSISAAGNVQTGQRTAEYSALIGPLTSSY